MTAAANTAFANRQVITHRVREVMGRVFGTDAARSGTLGVIYDVCHNTAKLERHVVEGEPVELVVHRKGATRSFGPGAPDLPEAYRAVGQPVIIGGSMETGSALLVGTAHAMTETFGSTAHGAGRTHVARPGQARVRGETLIRDMEERGASSSGRRRKSGVAEEAGFAYKDLGAVVDVVHRLDISRNVARSARSGTSKDSVEGGDSAPPGHTHPPASSENVNFTPSPNRSAEVPTRRHQVMFLRPAHRRPRRC